VLSGEQDSHFTSLHLLTQLNLLPCTTEYVVVVVVVEVVVVVMEVVVVVVVMMMDTPDHPPE